MSDRPANEMAIAVAKDVLENLEKESNPYKVKERQYINIEFLERYYNQDLQTVVNDYQNSEEDCTVCALGAALLSKARLYDAVPINFKLITGCGDVRRWIVEGLRDVFTREELDLMEIAFELSPYFPYDGFITWSNRELAMSAVQFGKKYDDPKERMKAIMQNIVDNNGHFVP